MRPFLKIHKLVLAISLLVDMQFIEYATWTYFGSKRIYCPGITKEMIEFFRDKKKLPEPCDKCYKGLIFWGSSFNKENLSNFKKMIGSFEFEIRGKYNKGVVVFYFINKEELLDFLKLLERKMKEYNVVGRIQWRRACKEYQDQIPEYWLNAKELNV
jgi:hypothetical protein